MWNGLYEMDKVVEVGGDAPMPEGFKKPEILWDVVIEMMGNPATMQKAEDVLARYVKEKFRDTVKYKISTEMTKWINSTTIRIMPKNVPMIKQMLDNLLQGVAAQIEFCRIDYSIRKDEPADKQRELLMTEALGVTLRNIGDSFTVTIKAHFGWKQDD